jgi:hypothetical protein
VRLLFLSVLVMALYTLVEADRSHEIAHSVAGESFPKAHSVAGELKLSVVAELKLQAQMHQCTPGLWIMTPTWGFVVFMPVWLMTAVRDLEAPGIKARASICAEQATWLHLQAGTAACSHCMGREFRYINVVSNRGVANARHCDEQHTLSLLHGGLHGP